MITSTTETTTAATDAPPSRRSAAGAVGVIGFALGVGYAVFVRFYQAAGGTIGLSVPPDAGTRWASYVAGLLVLVGAVAALVLTRPALRTVPRWSPVAAGRLVPPVVMIPICAVPTAVGAVIAIAHGGGGGLAKALEGLGLGAATIHAGVGPSGLVDLRWELVFYQPWFLIFGIALAASVFAYLRESVRSRAVRRAALAIVVVAALALSAVFVLSMMLHWNLAVG